MRNLFFACTRKDEKEDASSYRMTLIKREDDGYWKREHQIAVFGGIRFRRNMDLS